MQALALTLSKAGGFEQGSDLITLCFKMIVLTTVLWGQ